MTEKKRETPPLYVYDTDAMANEYDRRINMLMSILEEKAKKALHPDKVDEWLKDARDTIHRAPHEAERKMLTLRLAEVLQKTGSAYDTLLEAAHIDCSPYINKSFAIIKVADYVYADKESRRDYHQQVNNIFNDLRTYGKENGLAVHIADLSTELWDKYNMHKTGQEYIPTSPDLTSDEMKTYGQVFVHPERIDDWYKYVDRAYNQGTQAVATARGTLDILSAYTFGERLRDVKDMFFLVANMTPADSRELYHNLFEAYGGQGFGQIHSIDMLYLTDVGTRVEPEKSVPAIYQELSQRGEPFISEDMREEWERALEVYVTHGNINTMKSVEAGIEFIEALHDGVALEDIKKQFDERYDKTSGHVVASIVENFGPIEHMGHYLINEGPMPTDTREGHEGLDDQEGLDGPKGPGE